MLEGRLSPTPAPFLEIEEEYHRIRQLDNGAAAHRSAHRAAVGRQPRPRAALHQRQRKQGGAGAFGAGHDWSSHRVSLGRPARETCELRERAAAAHDAAAEPSGETHKRVRESLSVRRPPRRGCLTV